MAQIIKAVVGSAWFETRKTVAVGLTLTAVRAKISYSYKNTQRINSIVLDEKYFKSNASKKIISRAGWSESSKAIAGDGDDYLRLGDFPNLEDQELG